MSDLLAVFKDSGLPAGIVSLIVLAIFLAREFKLFERRPGKSDRELQLSERQMLSADEETFRRAMMDRQRATDERLDASEKARAEQAKTIEEQALKLVECEERHIEVAQRQDQQDRKLAECEERHGLVTGYLRSFIEGVAKMGFDILLDTTETAPMPNSVRDLLASLDEKPHGERRFMKLPVTVERRKVKPSDPPST